MKKRAEGLDLLQSPSLGVLGEALYYGVALDYSEFTCGIGFNPTARMAAEEEVEVTAKIEEDDLRQEALPVKDNIIETNTITLSPNPNNGKFKLSIETEFNGLCYCLIYNATGLLVKEVTFNNLYGSVELDCSNLAKGLYNIVCSNDTSIIGSFKFIIYR